MLVARYRKTRCQTSSKDLVKSKKKRLIAYLWPNNYHLKGLTRGDFLAGFSDSIIYSLVFQAVICDHLNFLFFKGYADFLNAIQSI